MNLAGKNIGFALTGSFCTFKNVIPIMSYNSYNVDTKFGNAIDFIEQIEEITGNEIIHTIQGAEPIGPKHLTDIMIIAPASRKYHC